METARPPTPPSAGNEKSDSVNHISVVPTPEERPPPVVRVDSYLDDEHVELGWRSWLVVFVTCFAFVS
jgi:hypothetical protein